jgi:hypothetical protein
MKRLLLFAVAICWLAAPKAQTIFDQSKAIQDSVVQFYGVVMTADSLRGLPNASIAVINKGRGTITNDQGVFSIAVMKGDHITFSSVGYKSKDIVVPSNLEGRDFSVIQLMVDDTAYLPATIIKPRPSRAQFERDFLNTPVPDDAYEVARQNNDESKRRFLVATLPADGREAVNYVMRENSKKLYYAGQTPPINLLNPFAWSEFIKAWKRGDFKSTNANY